MLGRSVALILGALGGVLILIGGFVAFLLSLGASGLTGGSAAGHGSWLLLAGTLILGFLVLLTCRPRLFWWPGRRLFNAVILVVLGLVTWVAFGGFAVTAIGALLTVAAGVVLPLEGLLTGTLREAGRLVHRRRLW